MDMVRMPKADWTDICDAVREKTETTDMLLSGAVAGMVRGISGGGSGGIQKAGGEYVLTENTKEFSINIDDIGFVPDMAFVSLDETDMTYDGTPTKAWAMYRAPLMFDRTLPATTHNVPNITNLAHTWRGAQGAETVQNGPNTLHFIGIIKNTTSLGINVSQTALSYPIIAGTYKWECYKIWEDE